MKRQKSKQPSTRFIRSYEVEPPTIAPADTVEALRAALQDALNELAERINDQLDKMEYEWNRSSLPVRGYNQRSYGTY